jgi:hypothetical protein
MSDLAQLVLVRLISRGGMNGLLVLCDGRSLRYCVRGILGAYLNVVHWRRIDRVDIDCERRHACQ